MRANTFYLFAYLPKELRDKIWGYALFHERTITFDIRRDVAVPASDRFPAMFQAIRESRIEGFRQGASYIRHFGNSIRKPTFFPPESTNIEITVYPKRHDGIVNSPEHMECEKEIWLPQSLPELKSMGIPVLEAKNTHIRMLNASNLDSFVFDDGALAIKHTGNPRPCLNISVGLTSLDQIPQSQQDIASLKSQGLYRSFDVFQTAYRAENRLLRPGISVTMIHLKEETLPEQKNNSIRRNDFRPRYYRIPMEDIPPVNEHWKRGVDQKTSDLLYYSSISARQLERKDQNDDWYLFWADEWRNCRLSLRCELI
ncbi:hypothetical protein BS50DRAFT_586877 [Corynespora cassiicola Philippines]|uniref:2EXR domain-containing protein n=1 Tax=Corynespora cassiicola Philippines TaxID=1448308 RepID=A0A2T2NQD1_CORCC|nr:hypothetical protein BS50DRAFT_586877 [Corynespora cassiicola Philippines]